MVVYIIVAVIFTRQIPIDIGMVLHEVSYSVLLLVLQNAATFDECRDKQQTATNGGGGGGVWNKSSD